MTKNEFALSLVLSFANSNKMDVNNVKEGHIFQSSVLAVAMEQLGMLQSEQNKKYAASRDGILYQNIVRQGDFRVETISVRDVLALLPD